MLQSSPTGSGRTFVYVSAAAAGTVDTYEMDRINGALSRISSFDVGGMAMPMAVGADKGHLYVAIRSQPYRLLTLAIDPATGRLEQRATAPLSDSMAYIATEPSGRLLLAASYGGDKVAALAIARDGLVTEGERQTIPTGRNAHSILSDRSGRYVFATNLGSDAILQFVVDPESCMLEANDPARIATGQGFGPRHIALSTDNKFLYVLTELTGHVIHYVLDPSDGTLTEVESVASVPCDAELSPGVAPSVKTPVDDGKPKVWAADIGITPNGRFLYTTERTTSTIALFRAHEESGSLTYVTSYPTEQQPRGIRIDPSGRFLVASGEKSDRLSVYAIDRDGGELDIVGRYPVSAGANWIEIVTFA
ncbi:lactonase family protein [Rhizobium sp. BR 314]|uniref:lactonase family protein n=1 Tax=Rhizobium sp. BR 314 TaxID=3040013 RepID=UPI0039BF308D